MFLIFQPSKLTTLQNLENVANVLHMENQNVPMRAYDLLDLDEREAVESYLTYVKAESQRTGERVALALSRPIPGDLVRRSKGLLNRPLVRAALADAIRQLSDEYDLSPQRLIREIGNLAHSNMDDFLERGDFGVTRINLANVSREQMAAVKSFKIVPTMYGNREEIQLYDKQPSQRMLAEMMGLVNNGDAPPPPMLTPPDAKPKQIDVYAPDAEKQYSELING